MSFTTYRIVRRTSDKKILYGGTNNYSGDLLAGEDQQTADTADHIILDSVGYDLDKVIYDGSDNLILKTSGELSRNNISYYLTDNAGSRDLSTGYPEVTADAASYIEITIQKQGDDGANLTDAGDTDLLDLKTSAGVIKSTSDVVIDSIALVLGTATFRLYSTTKTMLAVVSVLSPAEVSVPVTPFPVSFINGTAVNDTASIILKADLTDTPVEVQSGHLLGWNFPDAATKSALGALDIPITLSADTNPVLTVDYFVSVAGTGAGNVSYELSVKYLTTGDLTTAADDETLTNNNAVTNTVNRLHRMTFTLDKTKIFAASRTSFKLSRIGAAGADTFDGEVAVIEEMQLSYRNDAQ